jgi:hypothetical protein
VLKFIWQIFYFFIIYRSIPEFKIVREPLEGDPEFLIMDIQLPKVVNYQNILRRKN